MTSSFLVAWAASEEPDILRMLLVSIYRTKGRLGQLLRVFWDGLRLGLAMIAYPKLSKMLHVARLPPELYPI